MNAIYITFECLNGTPSAPVLLGVLKDFGNRLRLEQIVLTHAGLEAAVRALLEHNCPIIGWSAFDRDVLRRAALSAGLRKLLSERYVSVVQSARLWRRTLYPEFAAGRDSPSAPVHTLDKYARLAGYADVHALRSGPSAARIRRLMAAIIRARKPGDLTAALRADWRASLDLNRHRLNALRAVQARASFELGKWREYDKATYLVDPDRGRRFSIRTGTSSAALDAMLARHGATSWAFITAWNPGSVPLPRAENDRRQADLAASLLAAGHHTATGRGMGDDASWVPEESLLVFDISPGRARRFGRQFGQFAILAGHRGGPARLLSCAVPFSPSSSASAARARRRHTSRRPSGR